ncbi:MAG: hypothetical protein ACREKI_03920 [Gemmatimonadota bacterium]
MLRSVSLAAALAVATLFSAGAHADSRAAPDPSPAVQAAIARGDALLEQEKHTAARKAYRNAAAISREEGDLPETPLRRLANAHYFQKDYRQAAKVLDTLAREAAAYGDLRVEAEAIVDAAWLYGKVGDRQKVSQRLARVERLLESPYLPEDVKQAIQQHRLPASEA